MDNDNDKELHNAFSEENPPEISDEPVEESEMFTVILCILGAIVGTLPSALLWVVLKRIGVIDEIAAIFMMIGELYICNLMTKNRYVNFETVMVICVIVMAVVIYLCEKGLWAWEMMYIPSPYENSFLGCFMNFSQLLDDLDIWYEFKWSLIRSYALAAMGGITGTKWLLKTSKQFDYFDN